MSDSFMTGKIQTLQERVNLFNQMALPGQPLGMHMGTSYLVNDLARENKRLAAENAELREALKPFAEIEPTILSAGSSLPWEQPEEPLEAKFYWVVLGSPNKVSFTNEDLRRARAKIEGSGA